MSSRPEFYAGRGNNLGDLNSGLLGAIYDGIKIEIGADAAKEFVNMVGELTEDASATTFLVALRRLEYSDWKFSRFTVPQSASESLAEAISDAHKINPEGALLAGSIALAGMFSSGGRHPVFTVSGDAVISPFLECHKQELDKESAYAKKRERGEVSNTFSFNYG